MSRALAGLLLLCAVAQARSIWLEEFHADVVVHADGRVEVSERIRVRFEGSWNGIYRDIQYEYRYPSGLRGDIRLEVRAVEDEDGVDFEYEESERDGQRRLKIRVRGARDATRTVVVRYEVRDTIRNYGPYDEFYWNVTGHGWPFAIGRASAEVTLPAAIPAGEVETRSWAGPYGSRESGSGRALGGHRWRFECDALRAHEGLTVALKYPEGFVTLPSRWQRVRWVLADNLHLLVPLGFLLAWFVAYLVLGRDSLKGATIVPEFEAPFGLRPTEVGLLADEHMDKRDVTAAIVDLAVRRLVKIRQNKVSGFTLEVVPDWRTRELRPFEVEILDILFPDDSTEAGLGFRKYQFHKRYETIREKLGGALVADGYFASAPHTIRVLWYVGTGLAALVLFVAGVKGTGGFPYWLLAAASLWFMFKLCRRMPRRTKKGLEALRRIRGMEEYLATAERERLETIDKDFTEKLLPYALALDLHDAWREAFAHLHEAPPEWFESRRDGFVFDSAFDDFSTESQAAFTYTPRSSGGGGWSGGSGFSSGGGFSGGGFGGGGGGGW